MKLLHDNYSAVLERYIDLARKNLQTGQAFLLALQKDIFIQLYFQDRTKENFMLPIRNFTNTGSILYAACEKMGETDTTGKFFWSEEEIGSCDLNYRYFPQNDIQLITGTIRQGNNRTREYVKEIVIQADSTKREIKKANRTLSILTSFLA
ncbi:MAG: hypothetical protein LBN93_09510 [Candidatus Symbiothrix sp.]|jgi:hypothetical protein|nr:hypothetical protein [Candidatus Symbiothrix sp.]